MIDGLDKQAIERIAAHQSLTLNVNSDNTLKALAKALPTLPPDAVLWRALGKVSAERRNAGHGVRSPARRFPAFEEFTNDLEAVVTGFRELLATLDVLRQKGLPLESKMSKQQEYDSMALLKINSTSSDGGYGRPP